MDRFESAREIEQWSSVSMIMKNPVLIFIRCIAPRLIRQKRRDSCKKYMHLIGEKLFKYVQEAYYKFYVAIIVSFVIAFAAVVTY